jgi:hypothetical protein
MAKKEIPALADFARDAEAKAIARGITVCRITHPEAINGTVHEGTYSGIHLTKGDAVSATLSDGSTI